MNTAAVIYFSCPSREVLELFLDDISQVVVDHGFGNDPDYEDDGNIVQSIIGVSNIEVGDPEGWTARVVEMSQILVLPTNNEGEESSG